MIRPIEWKDGRVLMIDQRALPWQEKWLTFSNYRQTADAIRSMVIRGAPAIGVAAAMGYALAAVRFRGKDPAALLVALDEARTHLAAQRPTAVNLIWALDRMDNLARSLADRPVDEITAALVEAARQLHEEDIRINRTIGKNGARLLPDEAVVLTHCNAGALATGGYGTALGVVRAAVEAGKKIRVLAGETRPFLQGARLTAWELMKDDIPVDIITDNMAGHFMRRGEVDAVVVGADRVAANGDAANKIGTYGLAVLARENKTPFYVAAPLSTIDLHTKSGDDIPIEERPDEEITHVRGRRITPEGAVVRHPAFDVTPAKYIAGIVTEKGAAEKPYRSSIKALFGG